MPRRVYTYPAVSGWGGVNMVSTVGAFILAFGIGTIVINIIISVGRGKAAGPNPWDAPTLEWAVSSPPPSYNFAVIPTIASRHPLWEERLGESHARSSLDVGPVLDQGKETLATTVIDAEPDAILEMPDDSPWPLALTVLLAVLFTGLLVHAWIIVGMGALACLAALLGWLWPSREKLQISGARQ